MRLRTALFALSMCLGLACSPTQEDATVIDEKATVGPNDLTPDSAADLLGSSTQSKGGLTCNNSWGSKQGSTSCTGSRGRGVKWRLRVRCSLQSDYTGPWNFGPGSDAFGCTIGVQSASVVWG